MKRFLLLALTAGLLSPGISNAYQNDDFSKAAKRAVKEMNLLCMGYENSVIEVANPLSWGTKRTNYFLIPPSRALEIPQMPNNFIVQVFDMARDKDHSTGVWLFETKREYIAFLSDYDEMDRMSNEELIDLHKNADFDRIKFLGLDWMKNTVKWLKDGMPKSADYCD